METAFTTDDHTWLQQAALQIERKLSQLNTSEFSSGYCHYDMLPKNFHFEGDTVTFFDFDFTGRGWLVNDIMSFWQHLYLNVYFGKMTQDEANIAYTVFLDGYREFRSVSEQELAAMPYLMPGFWLFYSGFHTTHDQFYSFIQPASIKARFNVVRKLMEKYWEQEYLPQYKV